MGWLELIPLLKRLLPLMSRIAPMLESFIVSRATTSKDTEAALERLAGELKTQLNVGFTAASATHAELRQALTLKTEQLRSLTSEVRLMHTTLDEHDARMEAVELQVAGMARTLRTFALASILMLVICTTLLLAIFLKH
jgi:hypothetical protein